MWFGTSTETLEGLYKFKDQTVGFPTSTSYLAVANLFLQQQQPDSAAMFTLCWLSPQWIRVSIQIMWWREGNPGKRGRRPHVPDRERHRVLQPISAFLCCWLAHALTWVQWQYKARCLKKSGLILSLRNVYGEAVWTSNLTCLRWRNFWNRIYSMQKSPQSYSDIWLFFTAAQLVRLIVRSSKFHLNKCSKFCSMLFTCSFADKSNAQIISQNVHKNCCFTASLTILKVAHPPSHCNFCNICTQLHNLPTDWPSSHGESIENSLLHFSPLTLEIASPLKFEQNHPPCCCAVYFRVQFSRMSGRIWAPISPFRLISHQSEKDREHGEMRETGGHPSKRRKGLRVDLNGEVARRSLHWPCSLRG